jgi:RNA polymerase sigma-70 factor, ECF subfamily
MHHKREPRPGVVTLTGEQSRAADAETADVALAASGDARAFERLYRAQVVRIHSLVRRMLDADRADDVTQDVFVRAWQKLSTFRGEAAFGTWLHRLAVNVILAHRKTVSTERGRFDSREDTLDAVPTRRETPETTVDLEEAVSRLPDGARQVFVLHDVHGYTHDEIGKMLGVVPGTSKSQLHHARMALRGYLDR